MDIDFSSLASRIAQNVAGLRGCIIASRDGLVLGAYPADGEAVLRPAWLRFASLGEVEKGFIEFAGEVWVFVQRGPYAAFSVSAPHARPGLILEELEQVLRSAEEARSSRDVGARPDALSEAPRSKPRTQLHPEPRVASGTPAPAELQSTAAASELQATQAYEAPQTIAEAEPPPLNFSTGWNVVTTEPAATAPTPPPVAAAPAAPPTPPPAAAAPPPAAAPPSPPPSPAAPPAQPPAGTPATPFVAQPEDANVDRVLLSQEFAQLLEETGYDDDE